MTTLYRFPNATYVPASDLVALVQLAYRLGIEPNWLATVVSFESGFNPKALNKYSNAAGIIQFTPKTAQALLGTATREEATARVLAMPFQEQLLLAERYFAPYRGYMNSLEDTYLAVFYPAAIGTAPDFIVGRPGSAVYEQNPAFHQPGLNYITTADITKTIRGVYQRAQAAGSFDLGDSMGSGEEGGWGGRPAIASTTKPTNFGPLAVAFAAFGAVWLFTRGAR